MKKQCKLTTVQLERLNTTSIQHRLEVLQSLISGLEEIQIEDELTRRQGKYLRLEMVYEKGKLQNKARIKIY